MEKIFHKSLLFILYSLLFLFPFFFLPLTQEYFVTNKFYLLGFGVLLLILISTIQILISKKISWQKRPFDSLVLLFLTTIALSIIFSSPNKIQALLNPNFGLVMLLSLTILYFYLSRISINFNKFLSILTVFLSLITIVFYFQPFKNTNLPQFLAFLKSPSFTPLGSQLDLAIFLGFFVVLGIANVMVRSFQDKQAHHVIKTSVKSVMTSVGSVSLVLLALFLTVYSLLARRSLGEGGFQTILPPFRLSWFAALETLKTPSSALVGIGLDNFSAIFTRVKDFAYNQSPLWQINSFNVSRSAILQILTETGIFGLLAFGLLIFNVIKQSISINIQKSQLISIGYILLIMIFFPTSLIIWFLFFLTLSLISLNSLPITNHQSPAADLSDLLPIYIGTAIVSFLLIAGAGYFLGRSYASEYYFKKSLDGITKNNLKEVYDNQRQAVIFNPYIERFRGSFAQTNLLIANNLAQKDPKNITDNDRQTITQAIQAAIAEGKAVVSLNPQRADDWQNLASIYLNVINAAQGADVWTISTYQRAIIADPQNPTYRVGLGGVYYYLKKYDDALKFFEQAISLKPDWPNANYNYAWANFQKENYPQAVNAMQNTLSLLNQKLNKADYEKVQKELEEFKKMLPKEEKEATKAGETVPGTLNLPTPPTTQISPKIELPKEASPEAK